MNIEAPIHTLENYGLIRVAQIEPELEYLFKHALVQEASYSSILKGDRKQLHITVANEIESLYPFRLDELSAMLAQHYKEGGDNVKALHYYKRAGKSAFDKFANGEAEYNLRAALEICTDPAERAEISTALADAIMSLGKLKEAQKYFRDAIPFYRENNKLDKVAQIYADLCQIEWGNNKVAESLTVAQEGLKEVGELPPGEGYAELLRYAANGYVFNDMIEEAEKYIFLGRECAEKCGANKVLAQILITHAIILDRKGIQTEAIQTLQEGIAVGEESRDTLAISRGRNNLAYILIGLGRLADAREQIEQMTEFNRKNNSHFGEIWFLSQLNGITLDLGEIEKARTAIERALYLSDLVGGNTYRVQVEGARLQTLVYEGKLDESIEGLYKLKDSTVANNDKQMIANVGLTLSTALAMQGNFDEAAKELSFGINSAGVWAGSAFWYILARYIANSNTADLGAAQNAYAEGDKHLGDAPLFLDKIMQKSAQSAIFAKTGNFDEAIRLLNETYEIYDASGFRWSAAYILWQLGEISKLAKDKKSAKKYFTQAKEEYANMELPILKKIMEAKIKGLK